MKKDVEKIIEGFKDNDLLKYEKDGKTIVETIKSVFGEKIAVEVISTVENETPIKILILSFMEDDRPTIVVKKMY